MERWCDNSINVFSSLVTPEKGDPKKRKKYGCSTVEKDNLLVGMRCWQYVCPEECKDELNSYWITYNFMLDKNKLKLSLDGWREVTGSEAVVEHNGTEFEFKRAGTISPPIDCRP